VSAGRSVSCEGKTVWPLTSAQIRAARALLRWSAEDLARQSLLSVATIRRAELTDSETSMTVANDMVVRRTLEAAGVEFIDENGGGPGVRLRKRQGKKPSSPNYRPLTETGCALTPKCVATGRHPPYKIPAEIPAAPLPMAIELEPPPSRSIPS
jgi:hypothetical protein